MGYFYSFIILKNVMLSPQGSQGLPEVSVASIHSPNAIEKKQNIPQHLNSQICVD